MSDIRNFNKEFITNFIDLYRSLPCLWKIKSRDYADRNKKNDAYQKMVNLLKEVDPTANRDLVVKKINSLRSSYRKEKKKVVDSQKSGSATEEIYEPSLWYYPLLHFLDDQETPRRPVSNFDEVLSQDETDVSMYSPPESRPPSQSSGRSCDQEEEQLPSTSAARSAGTALAVRGTAPALPPRRFQRKKDQSEVDSVICSLGKRIKEEKPEDRHDAFGRNVANKLRHLPNDQRIFVEKVINDGLSMAELGSLTINASVYVPPEQTTFNSSVNNTTPFNTPVNNRTNVYCASNRDDDPNQSNFANLDTNISSYITHFRP